MHFILSLIKYLVTSHELMWFLLGGFTFLSIHIINRKLKESGKATKFTNFLVGLSVLLFDFTILWTIESYLENEVKAANMGLIIFGALTVVSALATYRLINKTKTA